MDSYKLFREKDLTLCLKRLKRSVLRILSSEAKAKISIARSGTKLSIETRTKLSAVATEIHGVAVLVTNIETGDIVEYSTMTEAGVALNVSRTAIKKVLQPPPLHPTQLCRGPGSGKNLRGKYIIRIKESKLVG